MTGRVLVDDAPVDKAGARVSPEARIRVKGGLSHYVSRGGDKLAGALEDLGVSVAGRYCIDVGASTGGFTDCLLQAGAEGVLAIDVGYGQLHPKLRSDPRVTVRERANARHMEPSWLPQDPDWVVVDASFISLKLLLPKIFEVAPEAQVLALVKPQFEVGKGELGKGGVVRDDDQRRRVVGEILGFARSLGYLGRGESESRLAGPKGNREIFVWLEPAGVAASGFSRDPS